ncbi:hypothetical protein B484DRAFT_32802, partial [Ochromonadaceae sp. CCMP2298]
TNTNTCTTDAAEAAAEVEAEIAAEEAEAVLERAREERGRALIRRRVVVAQKVYCVISASTEYTYLFKVLEAVAQAEAEADSLRPVVQGLDTDTDSGSGSPPTLTPMATPSGSNNSSAFHSRQSSISGIGGRDSGRDIGGIGGIDIQASSGSRDMRDVETPNDPTHISTPICAPTPLTSLSGGVGGVGGVGIGVGEGDTQSTPLALPSPLTPPPPGAPL